MKKLLNIAAALFATVASSQAFVIQMNVDAAFEGAQNSSETFFNNSSNGASFMPGFFTSTGDLSGTLLTDMQISALGANPAALNAAFYSLGVSSEFENNGFAGLYGATFGIAESADAGVFPLTIAQYSALQPVASIYGYITSTDGMELGVFNSNKGLAPLASLNSLQNQFTINFAGSGTTTAVIGSLGPDGSGVFLTGNALRTTPVIPEPSSFGLIGLAGMVLIFRRRRLA